MDELQKIVYIKGEEIAQSVLRYRNIMSRMEADVPIQSLCLPRVIENILLRMGCLRVYDVIDLDLAKIKGLGDFRRRILRSSIDQFLLM
jgi:hypothetical protein